MPVQDKLEHPAVDTSPLLSGSPFDFMGPTVLLRGWTGLDLKPWKLNPPQELAVRSALQVRANGFSCGT